MLRKLLLTMVGCCSLLCAARAATLAVGPGQPYTTIQSAINAANNGDTVLVSPGTYYENIDFKGKAITVTSVAGAATTVIDASGTNYPAVVFKTSETRNSIFNGFTVQGGGQELYYGNMGGIVLSNASPTISSNTITHNHCYSIYSQSSAPLIQNNEIDNTLDSHGDCSFAGGAAIYILGQATTQSGVMTTIIGNTLQNNTESGLEDAGGNGGAGIAFWSGTGIIENNVIRNNASPGGSGGAINVESSSFLTIAQNLMYGNSAGCGGGALAIQGNSGYTPVVVVANNTMVDNIAGPGGGFSECAQISQFYPSPDGYGDGRPSTVFVNNIMDGSTTYPAVNCDWYSAPSESGQPIFDHNLLVNDGGAFFGSYCIDVSGKYGNIVVDPQFYNRAGGDYRLKAGSPGIDAGNNSALALIKLIGGIPMSSDLAGNPRVQDATGVGSPVIDIGAYELEGLSEQPPTKVVLSLSAYSGPANSNVVLTATLSSDLGLPTGSATFYLDGTAVGTSGIANGVAVLGNVLLKPGVHSLYVTYPGQGSFPPAISVVVIANIDKYSTSLSLASTPNPSLVGQNINFKVSTSSTDSIYVPTPITLMDGPTTLATLTPDSLGNASFQTSALAIGYHYITASYAGDSQHAAASAYVYQNVINGYATNMTLTSSSNPSVAGQSVAFTAHVTSTASGSGTPTGSIVFTYGTTTLGTVALDNTGSASLSTAALPQGADTITATYQASGSFLASSATLTQNVQGQPQTIAFTQPSSPAYVATSVALNATSSAGQPVTYKVVSGPANVSGSTLTYTGAGTVVVEADQAGTNGFQAASAQVTVNATLLDEPVGTASGGVSTLVTMASAGTLGSIQVVTQGAANADFALMPGGTCTVGTAYAAGQTCTVMFGFDPTRPGQRYGGLLFSDGAGHALANSHVYGLGMGPQVGFLPGTQGQLGSGLNKPSGVAVDGNGNVFVSEYGGGLAEITAAGMQSNVGSFGITSDVAVDGSGDLIVTDQHNVYEVLAVNGSVPASPTVLTVGTGFTLINGVAVDATGDIFVATGTGTGTIVNGVVTYDGALYELQAVNGVIPQPATPISLGSGFGQLTGVAVDASNNVYVSDGQKKAVYELMAVNGVVPSSPVMRSLGGGFTLPSNVRLDAANDVYLTDAGAAAVYEILAVNGSVPSTNATVRTLGTGFSSPQGMVIDSKGNVFFADIDQADVVTLDYSDAPTLSFATTAVGATSVDSPQTATLFNNGNAPLTFAVPLSGTNASISPGFTIGSGSTCPLLTSTTNPAPTLAAGGYCTELVSFTPVAAGVDNGRLVASDNALYATNAMQTVLLNGTGQVATTTTLTSSLNPAGVGVSVTFTATVSSVAGAPTGTVLFFDGPTQIGVATLTNGVATLTTSALAKGTHTISATYLAVPVNGEFGQSAASLSQVIGYQSVTTTAVTPEPSTYGQPTVFTVHVAGVAGSTGTPSGTVTLNFCNGAQISITLDASGNGSVVQPYPNSSELSEPAGSCPYTASYAGDAYFFPSVSASTPYIVNPGASKTTVTGAPDPGFVGQAVTLTATVAGNPSPSLGPGGVVLPPGSTVATGTVQFFDGATPLGSAALGSSQAGVQTAALTTSSLAVGAHSITAVYSGDANLNGSTSSVFVETIEVVPTATTLTASPNPGEQNHAVTLTASVAALMGTATPVGSVAIYDGTTLLTTLLVAATCSACLPGTGVAVSFAATGLTPGTHLLQAFFTPSAGFLPSQSSVLSLVILPQDFTLTASPPTMTVQTEHHATMTLHLASLGGFTADVALSCNGPVPKWVTCYLPGPVPLAGDATVPVAFTIDTDAVKFFKSEAAPPVQRGRGTIMLAGLLPLALFFARRRRGVLQVLVVAALSLVAMAMTACTGYYPAHTEPGTYTVTVTAVGTAAGATTATTHALDVTLIVTP